MNIKKGMNKKIIFILYFFTICCFLTQKHVEAIKRNRLSNNFRKHLLSSSRFWVGKRVNIDKKPTFKHHDIAKNILLWGKRDLDDYINIIP
uniref:Uncharacterized protein n=1 Tax=Strongyloides stercoralis TaxID=6248 RepID=A0AAF5RSW0_STRER